MKPEYAESLPEGWGEFARFFAALGDPTRQKILLVFEPGEEIYMDAAVDDDGGVGVDRIGVRLTRLHIDVLPRK